MYITLESQGVGVSSFTSFGSIQKPEDEGLRQGCGVKEPWGFQGLEKPACLLQVRCVQVAEAPGKAVLAIDLRGHSQIGEET